MTTTTTTLELDALAWVYAMGSWYRGRVVKVTHKRTFVEYTSGTGTTRIKAQVHACIYAELPRDARTAIDNATGRGLVRRGTR